MPTLSTARPFIPLPTYLWTCLSLCPCFWPTLTVILRHSPSPAFELSTCRLATHTGTGAHLPVRLPTSIRAPAWPYPARGVVPLCVHRSTQIGCGSLESPALTSSRELAKARLL